MLSRLRRWLVPPKPAPDPEFTAKMTDARRFGVEQKRASTAATRQMRRDRQAWPHVTSGPIESAMFPERKEDRP
ncbi:MAG: hypothetical protein WBA46_13775 [Thermomicrobiales bacterium]